MQLRFGRREFKYALAPDEFPAIRAEIEHRLPGDVHAVNAAYPIVSEYFDTPDRQCFWERVDQLPNRRKLRMRCYGTREGEIPPSGFVEIKQKRSGTGVKRRVSIDVAELGQENLDLEGWLEDRRLATATDPERRSEHLLLHEMYQMIQRRGLIPVVQMRYNREAFEAEAGNLRITFDRDIMYRPERRAIQPDCPQFDLGILPPGSAVMEIKMTCATPLWLRELAGQYGLQRRRFSKYCRAIQALDGINLPGDPAPIRPNSIPQTEAAAVL